LTGGKTNVEAVERALGAFRKSMEDSSIARHIGIAIARGKLLFEQYLPRRLPSFRADFLAATGLTIEEYLSCVSILMPKMFDQPIDGPFFRDSYASQTALAGKFGLFLRLEAQSVDELTFEFQMNFDRDGFKCLRERPILRTQSGMCVILEPTFFMDQLTVSPLFRVLGGSAKPNAVFGAFGDAFEDYALAILERLYPPVLGVRRLFTNVKSRDDNPEFVIDALLNEGPTLVVMEVKAAFLAEKSILAGDPAEFLMELRKKYAVEAGQQDREVGVAQLAKAIRAIVLEHWSGAEIDHGQLKRIFPVLIVYDDRLASPGVGAFLTERFFECLGNVGGAAVRVEHLTVMTVDDLENKESSDGFTLTDVLSGYVAAARGGMVSLHNFIARDAFFNTKVKPNETLLAVSYAEVDELKQQLFPKPKDIGPPDLGVALDS
jgi:hypothetical protein